MTAEASSLSPCGRSLTGRTQWLTVRIIYNDDHANSVPVCTEKSSGLPIFTKCFKSRSASFAPCFHLDEDLLHRKTVPVEKGSPLLSELCRCPSQPRLSLLLSVGPGRPDHEARIVRICNQKLSYNTSHCMFAQGVEMDCKPKISRSGLGKLASSIRQQAARRETLTCRCLVNSVDVELQWRATSKVATECEQALDRSWMRGRPTIRDDSLQIC